MLIKPVADRTKGFSELQTFNPQQAISLYRPVSPYISELQTCNPQQAIEADPEPQPEREPQP